MIFPGLSQSLLHVCEDAFVFQLRVHGGEIHCALWMLDHERSLRT